MKVKCPNCGYHCYGWALTEPEHQTCPKCGTRLEISHENTTQKKVKHQHELEREIANETTTT